MKNIKNHRTEAMNFNENYHLSAKYKGKPVVRDVPEYHREQLIKPFL